MSYAGAGRKENVGMSNDKYGQKPYRRKTKVSWIDVRQTRVSRDLRKTRKGYSMANGLIFPYQFTIKGDGGLN